MLPLETIDITPKNGNLTSERSIEKLSRVFGESSTRASGRNREFDDGTSVRSVVESSVVLRTKEWCGRRTLGVLMFCFGLACGVLCTLAMLLILVHHA